jgi:hypothetical protein
MSKKLNNLKDQCDLNQRLLIEKVEEILKEEIQAVEETRLENKKKDKWLQFLMNDFVTTIMQRHLEDHRMFFNLQAYIGRVREKYHYHQRDNNTLE